MALGWSEDSLVQSLKALCKVWKPCAKSESLVQSLKALCKVWKLSWMEKACEKTRTLKQKYRHASHIKAYHLPWVCTLIKMFCNHLHFKKQDQTAQKVKNQTCTRTQTLLILIRQYKIWATFQWQHLFKYHVSPWYNHIGWLGVKYQVTHLLTFSSNR